MSFLIGCLKIQRSVFKKALADLRGCQTIDECIPDVVILILISCHCLEVTVLCQELQSLQILVQRFTRVLTSACKNMSGKSFILWLDVHAAEDIHGSCILSAISDVFVNGWCDIVDHQLEFVFL